MCCWTVSTGHFLMSPLLCTIGRIYSSGWFGFSGNSNHFQLALGIDILGLTALRSPQYGLISFWIQTALHQKLHDDLSYFWLQSLLLNRNMLSPSYLSIYKNREKAAVISRVYTCVRFTDSSIVVVWRVENTIRNAEVSVSKGYVNKLVDDVTT